MPDIPVWNKCDNRCLMCANPASFARVRSARYGLDAQIRRFEGYLAGHKAAYAKNADDPSALNLTGGEPTLHPEFLKLLAYFRRRNRGRELALLSNGRRFADPAFAAAALKAAGAPFSVAVSVHGPGPAAHDAVTGVPGSFRATLAGLRNIFALKGPGQTVEVRLILHRRSVKGLRGALALLLREFSRFKGWRAVAMHYELEGRALRDRSLALGLEESAAAVNACAGLVAKFGEFRLYHFPLCLLRKDLRARAWVSLPPEDRAYPAACSGCAAKARCVGVMPAYVRRFGAAWVRPLEKI
jgi:MoaA/NifB/PqqE/SkfB family radical SAM enzyme